MEKTILIHSQAPRKPDLGEPCNGCGICCTVEPCPVGVVVSGRRTGACSALKWVEAENRYRCGVMAMPATWSAAPWLAAIAKRLAGRLIAAGQGCDCSLEAGEPELRN
jgi:hypothetical protein